MKRILLSLFTLTLSFSVFADSKNNILLQEWKGDFEGVPPFDQVKVSDFKPALEEAMKINRAEMKVIANSPDAPTFDNTIAAMERSGRALMLVMPVYGLWSASLSGPEFQVVEKEMEPKLAAFQDEIYQNSKLFQRIETVYNSPEKNKLTSEQQRLVWYNYTQFVLHGARLNSAQKARAGKINQRLATLSAMFNQNQLADEENDGLVIDNTTDLAGLPQWLVDGAAAEATRQKKNGKWIIANTRSSMEPFLTYSTNRSLREKAFRKWTSRGDNGNSHDNNKIVTEILQLRAERSKILGYPSYADWHLADTMAKTPQATMDLMMQVWKPAVAQVHKEVADMQAIVNAEKGGFKIQPWDYRFYAEKVRKAKYDLDMDIVKPYLQLENIRTAMFWMASKLYGFTFVKLENIPVYHPDVSVYKVVSRDGNLVGLWYFDPYARPGKRSGAWMNAYREQERMDGKEIKTIVSNNSNFIQGKPGEPVLISWDDALTMFHEFGHALHGLNSNVTYPSLSGTNTARDFVEFPSQIKENYLQTKEVLKFLTDQKGNPLPKALIQKIDRAKTFNQGFATVEFLASAIVDMKLHLIGDKKIDPKTFERETLQEIGMPSEIVMRHRIPQFGHLFSSEEYASGYYGYLWADVLSSDAYEAFTETGNPYNPEVAQRLHDHIMSVGNTVDPSETYRKFRGRDPKVDALLRSRGFPVISSSK